MPDAENRTTPKPDPRALNACRHGITSRARFCAPEDEAAYALHCKGYAASWNPAGDYEIDLCQLASDITWRLKIAGVMQEIQQAEAMAAPVLPRQADQAGASPEYNPVWKECDKQLDLLSTYERRLHRNLNDTIKLLRDAQDSRKDGVRRPVPDPGAASYATR